MALVTWTPPSKVDLTDFGIQIPLLGSRADRVREALIARFGPPGGARPWGAEVDPPPLTRADLSRVHTPAYVDLLLGPDPTPAVEIAYELRLPDGRPYRFTPATARRPMRELVHRALLEGAATLDACERALGGGFCHVLAGGMHHAMADGGRGFCLFHDVVVALRRLQHEGRVHTVWVIDTDCHRGDGTAALTVDDPSILTFSIHMARGWPLDGPPLDEDGHLFPWFWPGTVDRGIPEGAEARYLDMLRSGLEELEVHGAGRRPELAVVVAGSDPSELDVLPSAAGIRLSLAQTTARDRCVYEFLRERGIPQAWVLAGGYGPEVWRVHAASLGVILEREGFTP